MPKRQSGGKLNFLKRFSGSRQLLAPKNTFKNSINVPVNNLNSMALSANNIQVVRSPNALSVTRKTNKPNIRKVNSYYRVAPGAVSNHMKGKVTYNTRKINNAKRRGVLTQSNRNKHNIPSTMKFNGNLNRNRRTTELIRPTQFTY
jgi:hypothetical protein